MFQAILKAFNNGVPLHAHQHELTPDPESPFLCVVFCRFLVQVRGGVSSWRHVGFSGWRCVEWFSTTIGDKGQWTQRWNVAEVLKSVSSVACLSNQKTCLEAHHIKYRRCVFDFWDFFTVTCRLFDSCFISSLFLIEHNCWICWQIEKRTRAWPA